jgi:hypothetical protein
VHFDTFNETYEITLPVLSAHNLVIGTLYVDIGETMYVINTNRPTERSEVRFERRSWFSSEEFKLEGEAYAGEGKKKEIAYLIEGNWNR